MYQDKTLVCKECNEEFIFTAGEQEFYDSKGFENEPSRCPSCRSARKQRGFSKRERQTYPAVCASCGAETQVPFKPTGEKPVYCRDCYQSKRNSY